MSSLDSNMRSKKRSNFWLYALRGLLALVFAAGFAYMGYGMGTSNYERVEARIYSIELTTDPADPNEQGEYTLRLETSDGRKIIAPCAESLCYMMRQGDTISADLTLWDKSNQLSRPVEIIKRP